jgi:malonate-semialdehyde dehydrogenase (acetylating)/methylmalonate-semialdehyde dehydrogenase
MDCYDPSTGDVMAKAPQCTSAEVEAAVIAAAKAFPAWADTPASKRVQVLFRMKALLDKHLDELTLLCAKEHGKILD